MEEPSAEIAGSSNRSIRSKRTVQDSISPSSFGSIQSAGSEISHARASDNIPLTEGISPDPDYLSPSSFGAISSGATASEAPDEILVASSQTIRGGLKALSVRSGKDKKADKSIVDCLNLVSKSCFRKVPPSSFYTFFRSKAAKPQYSEQSVDKVDAAPQAEKVVQTPNKKKGKLNVKRSSQGTLLEDNNTETIEKRKVSMKKTHKGANARKHKKGSVRKGSTTSGAVSVEAAPSSEKEGPEHVQHLEAELKTDEYGVELQHLEDATRMTGSLDVFETQGVDEFGNITGMIESDLFQVWKSGRIVSQDKLVTPLESVTIEPASVVVPSSVRRSSSPDSADSSSSSSSTGSAKSTLSSTQDSSKKTEVKIQDEVPINIDPTQSSPVLLQGVAVNQMHPGRSGNELSMSHSSMSPFGFDGPTGSFMVQSQDPWMSRTSLRPYLGPCVSSSHVALLEKPPDVLRAVSSSTIQLLKTCKALVEDKSDEQWAPIKDLMSVMSYDELTRKQESYIEDFETHVRSKNVEDQEEDVLTCPMEVREDTSTQLLGSNVTPSSSSASVLGLKKRKLMPDNFSQLDFMKYVCSDWERPPYEACTKPSPKDQVTERKEIPKNVSEAIDQINPDATYDVIFTYKLPKSSPFDLNDSLADVRFKCVQKWMNDNVNATYRSFFDSEIKGKTEEKVIMQLMEKLVALQLKIRAYEGLKQVKTTYSVPTVPSKSTFSADVSSAIESERLEEEEERQEDWSEYPSDAQIESEIGILMAKLEQLRPEDSEVKEKRVIESVDTNATEPLDKTSQSCQSIGSGSGSGSRRVAWEARGKRRRKEVKEQLEKLIGLLENKLHRLKDKIDTFQFEDCEQANEETSEVHPPFPAERTDSSHQPFDLQLDEDSEAIFLQGVDAKLRRDFLIDHKPETIKCKSTEKLSPATSHKSSQNSVELPTQRQRLQLYLLGLTDTWHHEEEEASSLGSDVRDKRLLGSLKKEEMQTGIRHIKHQKKHLNRLPYEQPKSKVRIGADDSADDSKSQPTSGSIKMKMAGLDQSKRNENQSSPDADVNVPFTCKCLCDRVSRFNAKRKEHFRTVLSENLWCLSSNAKLNTGNESKKPSHEPAGAKGLCPREELNEPDNFRGWLADTDTNLLRLFNRPPLDRLNKDYYGQPQTEKHQPSPELEKEDPKTVLKHRIEESMNKISKQEAEKFWAQTEQWYDNYRKCDKTWQLIEEFEKVDTSAMMKRDLSSMQEEINEKLKADQMKVKLYLELIYRKTFFENLKKLREEYECSLRNRVAAKEKEMEARKAFIVQSTLRDMKDKFGPIKEEHKKRCVEWMAQIRDRTNATSQTVKQRQARELALMVDKMDVAERTRRKLVAATGKEHEEMEKALGKAVEERDVLIEELDCKVHNLTRDVSIWKRAVREVLNSFKKFMYYILETRPDRAQYFLSLEKLYQIQMDDMIKEASEELEKVETSGEWKVPGKDDNLQPTMEIKCPSHDIRYPSERSTRTGSSSDTDIEKDTRDAKVAGHVVDAAIRAVLPTPEMSEGGEDEERVRELEELISFFVTPDSKGNIEGGVNIEEVCEEETTDKSDARALLVEETSDPEIPVEEFTRRRIRDMLQIISRRKPQIKGLIHL